MPLTFNLICRLTVPLWSPPGNVISITLANVLDGLGFAVRTALFPGAFVPFFRAIAGLEHDPEKVGTSFP
jgi:hypothetical protein